jgi:hypothetical protein
MAIRPLLAALLFAASTLLLAGCQDHDSATDVAAAREDANKAVASARQDANASIARANETVADAHAVYVDEEQNARKSLTRAEADAMIARAHATYDVATTQIDGNFEIEGKKCGSLVGVDKTACLSAAEVTRAVDHAVVSANRDEALVAASHH